MSSFDYYANTYDEALDRGLSLSGEDKTFFAKGRIVWLSLCLKQLGFAPEKVLDYGCGIGTSTPFFIHFLGAKSAVGLDPSANSLVVARESNKDFPVKYKLIQEHEADATEDLAFCNGVFHHIPVNERKKAVNYIANCLRPGGIFALWENNPWNPATHYVMRKIPFDRNANMLKPRVAKSLVKLAGLTVIRTDYLFVFPKPLKIFRKIEPYLTRFPFGAQYQILSRK